MDNQKIAFLVLSCFLAWSSNILEYRFGSNYGQVFNDYSNNGLYGVNGQNSSPDYLDVISTDRGIYFANTDPAPGISLPPNTKTASTLSFSTSFSIISWIMTYETGFHSILNRYNSDNFDRFCIYDYLKDLNFIVLSNISGSNTYYDSYATINCKSYTDKWKLIGISFNTNTMNYYINGLQVFTFTFSIGLNSGSYTNNFFFGAGLYMWNYIISEDLSSLSQYWTQSSSVCLFGTGCGYNCSPGIVDPDLGTGCLSLVTTQNTDATGVACPNSCSAGCSSAQCLSYTTSGADVICSSGHYSIPALVSSCSLCYKECLTCTQSNTCSSCIASNAHPDSVIGCKCNTGYYNSSTLKSYLVGHLITAFYCLLCDPSCLTCSAGTYYECTSCSNYYLSGVCLESCPLGYQTIGKNCSLAYVGQPTVRFSLDTIGYFYIDSISGLIAKPYNRLLVQSNGILNPNMRGIYLKGSESLQIESVSVPILAFNFTFSIWAKPLAISSVIVYKRNSSLLFSIAIISEIITTNILINNQIYQLSSSNACQTNEWNYISVTLEYKAGTSISIYMNNILSSKQTLTLFPFLDYINTTFLIGSNYSQTNSYIGFIYKIEIYADLPVIPNNLVTSNCLDCSVCPKANSCLPSCAIAQYYYQSTNQCLQCASGCETCINSVNCSLCADSNCINCTSFSPSSCADCFDGYELINSVCLPCNSSSYFDNSTKTCKQCAGLCTSCLSETYCLGCANNSYLNSSYYNKSLLLYTNECVCNLGYSGKIICTRNYFNATISINQTNSIILIFTEALSKLDISDLCITLNDVLLSFSIETADNTKYIITPNYLLDIQTGSSVKIKLNTLVSIHNSVLNSTTLSAELFKTSDKSEQKKLQARIDAAKGLAEKGAVIGVCAVLGASLINLDPTSLFGFLNTAEIYYSTYLFNLYLDPVLAEFFLGVRIQSKVPNPFTYFEKETNGARVPSDFISYGYSTNLFLLSGGVHIFIFMIFLALYTVLLILSANSSLKKLIKSILELFNYSVFLRFWVQTYLELLLISSVGIRYTELSNLTQIVDFLLCIIVLVSCN
jgi:Concanavalin A-like lectin/glucanases superfamily